MADLISMLAAAAGTSVGGGEYQISRSLRFNSADSAYLSRTPASAGDRKTFTWSGWVKRSVLATASHTLFGSGTSGTDYCFLYFQNDDKLVFYNYSSAGIFPIKSTPVYRDVSAWYHIVLAVDTTQATPSNRVKIWVNNQQITAFSEETYPDQNDDLVINSTSAHAVGAFLTGSPSGYFNGYLTEINFIDGQALTPSSFGEANETTGVWSPIKFNGPWNVGTGVNGFYLKFSNNSDVTAATLGADYSGNGNNWTPSGSPGFSVTAGAGNDSLVDTPTQYGTDTGAGGEVRGNYATFNPTAVSGMGLATLANGNLDSSGAISSYVGAVSTIAMSSGKWYWEHTLTGVGQTSGNGIVASTSLASAVGATYGYATATDCWWRASNGVVYNNSAAAVSGLATFSANDVMNIAVDFDAGKLWFGENGTWDSSGNPATGANPTITFSPGGKSFYAIAQGYTTGAAWTNVSNFGQRPFAYTAPSGFKALVTTNLPEPTVVQGDDYFNTVLYDGTGASQSITGVGFQPDWVWIKRRDSANDHNLYDAVRGGDGSYFYELVTNATDGENKYASGAFGAITTLDSDGFSVNSSNANFVLTNASGGTYVAWNWKANGTGSPNELGTISSTVSANTIAGISIVTYTGTGSAGATVGHGLGVAPSMIIIKNRDDSAGSFWCVYHKSAFVSGADPNVLYLNSTQAQTDDTNVWGNSPSFTETIFALGDYNGSNGSGDDLVAYCFAEVEGFSKFSSYTGNGIADGPFIFTGFRPAFLMVKRSSSGAGTANWVVLDTSRDIYNLAGQALMPNLADAEYTPASSGYPMDILSNGFKQRGASVSQNESTSTYIYMAFAENPFKYSLAR
jgi:hypothetical protein